MHAHLKCYLRQLSKKMAVDELIRLVDENFPAKRLLREENALIQ